jgi:transcriptional regulator with XRE-family HTH domain
MTGYDLKRRIAEAGLTQRTFAELIGYTPETISRLIHGPEPVPRVIAFAAAALTLPAPTLEALAREARGGKYLT